MYFKSSFRFTEQLSREQRASPPAHPSQPAVCPGITVLCSGGASVRLMSRANELSLTEVRSSREGPLCVGHSVGLDKSITAGVHTAESPSGPTARKGLPPSSAHSAPPHSPRQLLTLPLSVVPPLPECRTVRVVQCVALSGWPLPLVT